jgi:hypothetical protein
MYEPSFLSLADIGQLPALPMESKLALVAIGLVAFGYICGRFDREPRGKVEIDWKPHKTIGALAEAEIIASAPKTAMGVTLPTPEEIKARQDALAKLIKGHDVSSHLENSVGKQSTHKPTTRGQKRASNGQFLPMPRTAR